MTRKVPHGLKIHPDRVHMIYPLGCNLVIENLQTRQQEFLLGHNNNISCVTISNNGKYIASGQLTFMGFKADIIIWDYESRDPYARLVLHKVKIEDLVFSSSDKFLFSLGGQDDGSIVVWNIETKEPVCGSPAQHKSAGITYCLAAAKDNDYLFYSAGNGTLRFWQLDVANRKIRPTDINTGTVKRIASLDGTHLYCGTTTGDVLMIYIPAAQFKAIGPEKKKYSMGITAMQALVNGDVLLGTGEGKIHIAEQGTFKSTKCLQAMGEITSLALRGEGHMIFIGTDRAHIYKVNYADWKMELINTCHNSPINDIAFPFGSSELFGTCSFQDIRIWHAPTGNELLRITQANKTCNSICFTRDGKIIVSGWDDGRIRCFYPETGREMFTVNDAHHRGVTAVAVTNDCRRIVSGGGEGMVRVWQLNQNSRDLIATMKEHKNAIVSIRINKSDTECVTASLDGTCIIWNLKRFARNQVLFENTLFQCVTYHPEEYHIITGGTDRKIAYWEAVNGAQIRELEASKSGTINGLDIDCMGHYFVTVSADKLVKLWRYNEGEVFSVGIGHGSEIKKVKICPNTEHIVSVSADGAIFRWKFPKNAG
ncbi:unnamed protein product [Didymodactylos carnosus]|uniref:Cilia- and flagella-associated protein 52 n=1 Tax=Didymodactylos carnosus TaxID=1234261 RepID=A0A813Z307_9BILA|nr:unnamed protein product [Didymodactylos carnosus]CAF3676536.1 unnamed protein product [Didymodactylos carnosus]